MNESLPGIFQKSQNMHVYIYKTNFLVDFVLNKKMTEEKKKLITGKKHPGRVAHGH